MKALTFSSLLLLTRLRLLSTSSTTTLSLSSSSSSSSFLRTTTTTLSPPPFTPPPSRPPFIPAIFAKPRVSISVSAMSSVPGSGGADRSNNGVANDFALSPSSYLKIRKGDITQWSVDGSSDAIVNAANERMLGGAGVDGAIHRAAGPELKEACHRVPEVSPGVRCPTGEARITPGFRLPASHVIHTVGPIYDVDKNPEASLKNAYKNSLLVAKDNNIRYIAFPAISCGVYGYPYDEAANIAISTVKEFADDFKEMIYTRFGWRKQTKFLENRICFECINSAADRKHVTKENRICIECINSAADRKHVNKQ